MKNLSFTRTEEGSDDKHHVTKYTSTNKDIIFNRKLEIKILVAWTSQNYGCSAKDFIHKKEVEDTDFS